MVLRVLFIAVLVTLSASGCQPTKTKQQFVQEEKDAEQEELNKIKSLPSAQLFEILKTGTVIQRRAVFAAFPPANSPPREPDKVFLAALCEATKDQDAIVRARAVKAIRSNLPLWRSPPDGIFPVLSNALKDPEADVRAEVLETFSKIGSTDDSTLKLILDATKDTDTRVRALAASSLGRYEKHADRILPVLKYVLKDKEAIVRQEAIFSLGRFGDKSLVLENELLLALQDPGDRVRWQATVVLEQIGRNTDKVVPAILVALEKESVAQNREWFVKCLKNHPTAHRETVPVLVHYLSKDQSEDVRAACAESLGVVRADPKQSIPALLAAAKDPSDRVRVSAFQSLGHYGIQAK